MIRFLLDQGIPRSAVARDRADRAAQPEERGVDEAEKLVRQGDVSPNDGGHLADVHLGL